MTITELQATADRAQKAVDRHKDRPRSNAYTMALARLYDAKHALLRAELEAAKNA